MKNLRKMTALTKAGVIESLQFRLGTMATLFGNLIYLALVYFLWKAIYESAGTDTVYGMTFYDTMIYLILATAIFNLLEMYMVWEERLKPFSAAPFSSPTAPLPDPV